MVGVTLLFRLYEVDFHLVNLFAQLVKELIIAKIECAILLLFSKLFGLLSVGSKETCC